ncbi:MAG: 3-dehydroquinate synthase [uncultured bacterium]|nr:MAG: 3-dehydroquinate synthase [uncultured bacterium]
MNDSFTIDGKRLTTIPIDHNQFQIKSTPKSYHVTLDENKNPFDVLNTYLSENKNSVLLIDENILQLYKNFLKIDETRIFSAKATENFKTIDGMFAVLNFLSERDFTKKEKLIVVGGGIIQEVGGFVSACYKRGIQWVYFPTTLLSMCDSCIGGKVSLNYKNAKNQIGLFHPPDEVIINPIFLQTLTDEALRSGMGEILKSVIIGGPAFLSLYQKYVVNGKIRAFYDYKTLILNALSIKCAVIQEDEFESHHRKSLNYGHTLGHAIESLSDYTIPHGLAVLMGMMLSNELSCRHSFLTVANKEILNGLCLDLLDNHVIEIMKHISIENILSLLKKDKKIEGKFIHFVMIKEIGDTFFMKILLTKEFQNEIESILRSDNFFGILNGEPA